MDPKQGSGFLLSNMPMPPSSNNIYPTNIVRGRPLRFMSKEMREFNRRFALWGLINKKELKHGRVLAERWIQQGLGLRVNCYFFFPHSRLLTKDGRIKKLDTFNRVKVAHDALAEALSIDDKYFVSGSCFKDILIQGREFFLAEISSQVWPRKIIMEDENEEKNQEA